MKLVRESIEQILKPKSTEDIYSHIDPLIDEFINNVTVDELDQELDNYEHRKLVQADKYEILTNEENLFNIIDSLATSLIVGKYMHSDDYDFKHPEFYDMWMGLQSRDNISNDMITMSVERVMERFAEKFNIEY